MPSAPLPPLRKKKRPSNTRLIVGLSAGAGGAVLVLLLIILLWPSGNDKELAKEEAAPSGESQVAVEIPAERKKEYAWLEGSAPFDVAEFLAPIPEAENAAPLYLEALVEFDIDVLSLLVSDKERLESIWKQRRPAQTRRNDQYTRFDEAWGKDPRSVNVAEVDAWLAEYEAGFKKLALAQQRPGCVFPTEYRIESLLPHVHACRWVVRVVAWRTRRDVQRGDFDRPIQGVETVLRLSRDVRNKGTFIAQLVGIAVDDICCQQVIPEILLAPGLRREHCDRLLAAMARHEAEAPDSFLEGYRTEYLLARNILYDFQHRTGTFDKEQMKQMRWSGPVDSQLKSIHLLVDLSFGGRLAKEKYGRGAGPGPLGASAKLLELDRRLKAMTAADYSNEAEALNRVYASILALAGQTMLQRSRACSDPAIVEPLRDTMVAVFLEPEFAMIQACLRCPATLRGTQCLVALRRWQLEHRQPPKDLDTVVKAAGMSGVPIDPYCDQPLRMTLLQGEHVIYSVGKDGKDDRALADWRYGSQPGDFVLRLQAPHQN